METRPGVEPGCGGVQTDQPNRSASESPNDEELYRSKSAGTCISTACGSLLNEGRYTDLRLITL